jgi:hypothetical protein
MTDNDTYNYVPSGNVKLLPEISSPTDVMDTDEGWRISNHFLMMTRNRQSKPPETIMEYIMKQKEYISQYYTQINKFKKYI